MRYGGVIFVKLWCVMRCNEQGPQNSSIDEAAMVQIEPFTKPISRNFEAINQVVNCLIICHQLRFRFSASSFVSLLFIPTWLPLYLMFPDGFPVSQPSVCFLFLRSHTTFRKTPSCCFGFRSCRMNIFRSCHPSLPFLLLNHSANC